VIESAAPTGVNEPARLTPSGLQIADGIAFDAWAVIGRKITGLANACAWCTGDWLVYGERAYGERYKTALETTSLDYQTLRNYAWVARRVEPSRRRDRLSFQHHAEVAALPEADQELWLSRAERSRWPRNELRRQVQAARRGPGRLRSRIAMTLQVEVTEDRVRRWRDAATAAEQELPEWIAATVDAAADAVLVAGEPEPRTVERESAAFH
jgi:hypothetical protein